MRSRALIGRLLTLLSVSFSLMESSFAQENDLLSDDMRAQLATKLNDMIDIPILGENQEQVLAERVVTMCLNALSENNEFAEVKKEFKQNLVVRLNEKVNIPFANEQLEAKVLSKVVDFVLQDLFSADAEKGDLEDSEEREIISRIASRRIQQQRESWIFPLGIQLRYYRG